MKITTTMVCLVLGSMVGVVYFANKQPENRKAVSNHVEDRWRDLAIQEISHKAVLLGMKHGLDADTATTIATNYLIQTDSDTRWLFDEEWSYGDHLVMTAFSNCVQGMDVNLQDAAAFIYDLDVWIRTERQIENAYRDDSV